MARKPQKMPPPPPPPPPQKTRKPDKSVSSGTNVVHFSPGAREEYKPFAEALFEAMTRKHMNASDVARNIWGTITDYRGYEVAKNRDRITFYLQARSYPRPDTMRKLVELMDLPPEFLKHDTPARGAAVQPSIKTKNMQMTVLDGDPSQALFTLSMVLPTTFVAELIQRIEAYRREALTPKNISIIGA